MGAVTLMTAEQLLAEFRQAWVEGRRPRVEEYVERADADIRTELVSLLDAFLLDAPRPEYSEQTLAEISREPAVRDLVASLGGDSGMWPSLLPRLRRRTQLTRDQVVERLMEALDLPADAGRKVKRYLHGMETGTLEPEGVSGRVLEVLAASLGSTREQLERAGEFEGLGRPVAAPAHFRADALEVTAASAPVAADQEWDEVDRLFRGGRSE